MAPGRTSSRARSNRTARSARTRSSRRRIWRAFAPGFSEEFDRAVKDGFTDAEVQVGEGRRAAGAQLGAHRGRHASRARLSSQAFLGRTFATSAAVDAAIEKLTPQDVNAVLRKYLKPGEFAYAFAGDFDKPVGPAQPVALRPRSAATRDPVPSPRPSPRERGEGAHQRGPTSSVNATPMSGAHATHIAFAVGVGGANGA